MFTMVVIFSMFSQ